MVKIKQISQDYIDNFFKEEEIKIAKANNSNKKSK